MYAINNLAIELSAIWEDVVRCFKGTLGRMRNIETIANLIAATERSIGEHLRRRELNCVYGRQRERKFGVRYKNDC